MNRFLFPTLMLTLAMAFCLHADDGFAPREKPTELAFADKTTDDPICRCDGDCKCLPGDHCGCYLGESRRLNGEGYYKVESPKAIDGDTIEGDIILPFDLTLRNQRIRVLGVDTWETKGVDRPKGEKAKECTSKMIKSGKVFVLPGKRYRDNFGRALAYVFIQQPDGKWIALDEELRANGHDKE